MSSSGTATSSSERSRWLYRGLPVLSVLLLLTFWSILQSRTLFLPPLDIVARAAADLLTDAQTYWEVAASVQRLVIGIIVGTGIALIVVVATSLMPVLLPAIRMYNAFIFGVPSLLLAFLSLTVVGVSGTGVTVVVAIIIFPFVADPLLHGLRGIDELHLEMAQVFRFPDKYIVRHVVVPHLAPYLLSGLRNGHAIAWKVLVVAEIFSVRSGLGYQFKAAFDFFRIAEVLVWLILLLAMIGLIEYGLLRTIETRIFSWRMEAQ